MRNLKTTPEHHAQATINLKQRRRNEGPVDQKKINDNIAAYARHIFHCGYGQTVLDLGCGRQYVKQALQIVDKNVEYLGVDAFPAEGFELSTTKMKVEDPMFSMFDAETIVAFAVLDNCMDFDLAIQNMKAVATRNIIILTGIGIPVDQYHTMRLELEDFDSRFNDWNNTVRTEVAPKVWLLNFEKP